MTGSHEVDGSIPFSSTRHTNTGGGRLIWSAAAFFWAQARFCPVWPVGSRDMDKDMDMVATSKEGAW